jgi:hypothetical protein
LVEGATFNLYAAKMVVPDVLPLLKKVFRRAGAKLMIEIVLRLFEGDKGGCDANIQ